MKKIEAIIRQERLAVVQEALEFLGYPGMTVTQVRGRGIQGGVSQQWRGKVHTVDLLPKCVITIVVSDQQVSDCIDIIAKAAETGFIGDGKIFVTPVESAMRIRTGERGCRAV